VLAILASSGCSPAVAERPPLKEEVGSPSQATPLVYQRDLIYLGAFRLPGGQIGESSFEYGGTALAFNPARNSLFLAGHDHHQALAEVAIPEIRTGPIPELATAKVLQPFVDVRGRIPELTLEGNVKVGGLLVQGERLVGTLYEYYDGDANAVRSHFRLSSLELATAEVSGLFQVGDAGGGFVGGYMAPVPARWQAELGCSHLTGQAALAIVGRTSCGPCAMGFEPAELGVNPVKTVPYVYYPLKHPLAAEDTQNPLFNTTTEIRGVVFPEQSSSVLFFGSHGVGPYWYGEPNHGGKADPYRDGKGPHAPPYVYQVWAYDVLELLAVKEERKSPWEVRPYEAWTFHLPYREESGHLGGAAYDAKTARIYVSQQNVDQARPVIHVFQVQASARDAVYSYDNPRPLPPASPDSTVTVSNVSQLTSALAGLQSGQTISLTKGTYDLTGVAEALYVPEGIKNWTIRGASDDRSSVVIKGDGMSGSVRFGFWVSNSPGGTIADLTIDGVRDHGIVANPGAHKLLVHNVRIVDSGDQFVKSNPNESGRGNDQGIVEYCVLEYRTTDNDNYTNGVDVHGGKGWIVRHNLFKNLLSPPRQGLAGPAVLMWKGSRDSVIEGNTFVNVARGVSLGLSDEAEGHDHQGGVIRSNMFYRDARLSSRVDVPILVADSPGTKIHHNTVVARGSYPNAIEYRYVSTTGVDIKNNLTDGAIEARDGATATLAGNVTSAELTLFISPTTGDLHLLPSAGAINQGVTVAGLGKDFDGQTRDARPDVGADEYLARKSRQ
jgi:hypothetical protein